MAEIKNNLIELEVVYSKLNKQIDENISKLQAGAVAVDNYNKKISVVPSEFQKSLTDIKAKTDAITQSNKQLEASERKLQQERIKELQLQKQREVAVDKYNAQLAKEQRLLEASESLYNKVQNKLNSLSNEYKNLAVRKELGLTLTAKEEQRYTSLQGKIQTYDKTLKAVDATIGKHQRNVGNYASAFNPLQNSINQLGREMPAFANSVQTGFMAISNNLPIFFDAITQTKNEIKALKAQGQQVPSLFSQLTSSLLSWGTALSVGVTLLTVYGKEMVNFVTSLFEGSQALKELNENQKVFNASKLEGKKESIAERSELEKYVRVMRNSKLELIDRETALKKIRDQFPAYFKNLTDEQVLNGNIKKELAELNLALERRAVLEKATESNVKNKQRLVDLQAELSSLKQIEETRKREYEAIEKINGIDPDIQYRAFKRYNDVQKDRIAVEKDIIAFQKAISGNDKLINELKGQTIKLEETLNKEKDKSNKVSKEKVKLQKEEIEADKFSVTWFEKNISALETQHKLMSFANPMRKQVIAQLGLLKSAYALLYGEKNKDNEATKKSLEYGTISFYENEIKLLREMQQLTKDNERYSSLQRDIDFYQVLIDRIKGVNKALEEGKAPDYSSYFQGFVDEFSGNSGFSQVIDIMSGKIEGFGEDAKVTALAISEAFQQAFNTIAQASQANFDAEYQRLETQRDFAIEMAGGSASAREEIERQYEERKKQIQRREAEAQKRLALFNIAVNTAQGIISALAMTPPNVPLSIAIGVIGAVQAGIVASKEIPQFWKGTDNAPEGWAWTQEKGAEVITDKSGNVKTLGSNKGAQLTYLQKGDKVYKSHEDYINKVLSKNGVEPLGTYLNIPMQQNNSFDMQEMKQEFSKLAKVISNKDGVNISIDERGFRKAQGNKEFLNARMNLKSRVI